MLRKLMLTILVCFCLGLPPCSAETGLYFAGYDTKETFLSEQQPCIYFWSFENNQVGWTGIHGYIIEGSKDDGVLAIVYGDNEDNALLVSLSEGLVKERMSLELPCNCEKVLAYKNGLLIYVYYENEDSFGIRSLDSRGVTYSYYCDEQFLSVDSLCTAPVSADDKGNIVFQNDGMWICRPDERAEYLCDCPYDGGCVFTAEGILFFVNEVNQLCAYDVTSGSVSEYGGIEPIHCYHTNIAISEQCRYVAYQKFAPSKLFGFLPPREEEFNRIVIVDMNTGKPCIYSPYVYVEWEHNSISFES